ncbi:MAG: hypothetical protein IT454_20295 [Planctomycetes bacterium]|nr:hypothetical protein [Planctomycetota bacterium]
MNRSLSLLHGMLLALAAPALCARAQTPGGAPPNAPLAPPQGANPTPPQGPTREQTWYAPTAEDWAKPCLITWQRTFDDALAVARATGKPVLVCVNMDGEIASEHYAGVRYRQPDIAQLYEPYVCVIASVYRHTPRDHDERGQRIPCPRFGSVTCGEHIAIEPLLFDKFMDGRRIAPRHIMIEPEQAQAEVYDVFYAFDTASVFKSIREGVLDRPPTHDVVRSDRPALERVASADTRDRAAVEQAFVQGDAVQRRRLLESALQVREVDPVELLRLALFGFDLELAKIARKALCESTSEAAIDLIGDALRVPLDALEREALVAALERLGGTYPRARTLAAVQRGLASRSAALDSAGWARALEDARAPATDSYSLEARLESQSQRARSQPEDAQTLLELAESNLALATAPETTRKLARLLFQDARDAALAAEKLGASGWRVHAAVAVSSAQLGEFELARTRAEAAVGGLPADPSSWSSMAVLELFADARQRAIWRASREKKEWPPQWLTDVHAAYAVLARHPLGTDLHVATHHDFLRSLGAHAQAARVLDEGLARFASSWVLHDRLRGRILAEKGVDGLEPAYDELARAPGAAPDLEWFAGYASIVAAEYQRRAGAPEKAVASYARALAHYDACVTKSPESRASSDHYAALALGGRARVAFERGDLDAATTDILASFARRADAAATLDGLNLSPVDTAKQLRVRAIERQRPELATRLQAALDALDPELLRLPAFEREAPPPSSGNARPPERARDR